MNIFTALKYCCIFHGRVFEMDKILVVLFDQFSIKSYFVDINQLNVCTTSVTEGEVARVKLV